MSTNNLDLLVCFTMLANEGRLMKKRQYSTIGHVVSL